MAKRLLAAKLNLLSARQVFNAREAELSDGGGLLLRCFGAQAAWVFRYTSAAGKRREMGFGTCARHSPQAAGESLTAARSLAAQARTMLASNPPLDPIDGRAKARVAAREAERRHKEEKQREKLTLARAARAYHEKFIEPRKTPKFAADWIRSLENHVPPELWHKPIAEITRAELLDLLRDIQHRMADTAQRVRRRLDEVFDEAIEQGAVTLNPVAMVYDDASRIGAINHPSTPSLSQTYGYDRLDRLTNWVQGASSRSYGYDANGNRSSLTIGGNNYTYTTPGTSNRLASTSGPSPARTFTYDAAGSITADGQASWIYNDRGRLVSATQGSTTATYTHDGLGQRLKKTGPTSIVPSGTNYFVYDEWGKLLGEYDNTGAVIQEYVYLGESLIALLRGSTGSPDIYYVYADQVGRPWVVTNAANQVRWRWDTSPFGELPADENPSGLGTFTLNLRFPGQYRDAETGLFYNYFRDYDPQTGRYVQSDPIGLEGGLNTYSYVDGNPLSRIDPLALLVWNYGPTEWSSNLTTGSPYAPFPGAPSISIPAFVGGTTSIDWWITSACVCDANGYKFNEFTVDLFPMASVRSSYPGGQAQAAWSRRAEGDHLADLNTWQVGGGRSTAQRLENELKGRVFATLEECERYTKTALQQALAGSAGQAVARSRATYDVTGRHNYNNRWRRP